ncbi:MAG: 2-5 ligase superfamily [Actinomycetia bacterium]|nr:2-5 ligase superfamily [Actinomycetes bacterium]
MSVRIRPHVTLVHDVTNIDVRSASLENVAAQRPAVALQLLNARTWGPPGYGIYLAVSDIRRDIENLRRSLSVAHSDHAQFVPHVTLSHPRTVPHTRALEAWSELATWSIDETVTVDAISLIESESDGGVWRTVITMPLRGT